MVAGCRRWSPWAVEMRSALKSLRNRGQAGAGCPLALIRAITCAGIVGRRPRRTPCARARASATPRPLGEPSRAGGRSWRARPRSPPRPASFRGRSLPSPACARSRAEPRLRRPVLLGGDEHMRVSALPRPLGLLAAASCAVRSVGLLGRREQLPAARSAGCRELPALRLQGGAALAPLAATARLRVKRAARGEPRT